MITRKYKIQNLDCANCAAKMETRINAIPEVAKASITFATKQLQVTAEEPELLLEQIRQLCLEIEPDVMIMTEDSRRPAKLHPGMSFLRNQETFRLITGALLFAFGIAAYHLLPEENNMPAYLIALFIISYLILGADVLRAAVKGITKKQIFNENFLMAAATIGAISIGDYPEAAGVMLFFGIGEWFEHRAVEKSRKAIMDAVDLRPETVFLIKEGVVTEIQASDAKPGDTIQVRPGDRIPLDGTVLDGTSRLDTSPITGEPVPVHCKKGDSVLSGCLNNSGLLTIRVEKKLKDSMVSKILDAVENAAAGKPKIDRFITRFAKIYTPMIVFSALAVAIIPSLFTGNWNNWIYTALTFLVISCPCALVLSVPLAFFSGIGTGSRHAILFKNGSSLEALNHLGAIVMDKTGTITLGTFCVTKIEPENNTENHLLSQIASLEQASSHPIAESILQAAKERDLTLAKPEHVKEVAGQGISARIEGVEILCGKISFLALHGVSVNEESPSSSGTTIYCAAGGIYMGKITLSDTIKEGASDAIMRLKKSRLHTAMLTGDHLTSAEAIGSQAGIDEIHSDLLPIDKLEQCQRIRNSFGAVMFIGDGINDAPVLAGADVGAAMGSGADAAIDAADVVFMTSDMKAIPLSIQIAKQTLRIAKQNIGFALTVKALILIFGLLGIANMWLAVFADSGVAMLCVLNSIRTLRLSY